MSFSVIMNSYIGIFDLNRNLERQNKENFVKKNRRFVDVGIVKTCDELDLCLQSRCLSAL